MLDLIYFADSDKGACYKFRVAIPMKYLNRMPDISATYSEKWVEEFNHKGHLFTFQRNSTDGALKVIWALYQNKKLVVYDMDDDIFHIPENNPVFNLYMNDPGVPWRQAVGMRFSNVVTVSCDRLKSVYSVLNKDVVVLPNCVDLEDWVNIEPILRKSDAIRIFWGGSPTHKSDLAIIRDVLKQLKLKYPIEIIIMGNDNEWFPCEVTKIPFGDYKFFQQVMKSCDIGLAPLASNTFNLGKSDLRLKELGMAELAIVASDEGEYHKEESGALLCKTPEEWYSAISILIENEGQRKLSAKHANEWTKSWDIRNYIHLWTSLYERILDEHGRGSSSKTIRIQDPKRFTGQAPGSGVRVGELPHSGNDNT